MVCTQAKGARDSRISSRGGTLFLFSKSKLMCWIQLKLVQLKTQHQCRSLTFGSRTVGVVLFGQALLVPLLQKYSTERASQPPGEIDMLDRALVRNSMNFTSDAGTMQPAARGSSEL